MKTITIALAAAATIALASCAQTHKHGSSCSHGEACTSCAAH